MLLNYLTWKGKGWKFGQEGTRQHKGISAQSLVLNTKGSWDQSINHCNIAFRQTGQKFDIPSWSNLRLTKQCLGR